MDIITASRFIASSVYSKTLKSCSNVNNIHIFRNFRNSTEEGAHLWLLNIWYFGYLTQPYID